MTNGQRGNWVAISGRWRFDNEVTIFSGQGEPAVARGVSFPIGLAVSDRFMQSGRCRVKIRFSVSFDPARAQAGGIVLGYKTRDQHYVVVQLGAFEGAFMVSESVPGFGWRSLAYGGSREDLAINQEHSLDVEVAGQDIRVKLENVPVIRHLLSRPLAGTQVGLIGAGGQEIQFREFEVDSGRPRAFVAMEFAEPYNTFYREVIQKQAQDLNLDVVRIDEVSVPGVIFQDIQREIQRADVVIAEVSPSNPNVFYELGYAHALNKPTILLAQRGAQLPFDIRSYRVVFYNDTIGGKAEVERNLRKHLESVLTDTPAV